MIVYQWYTIFQCLQIVDIFNAQFFSKKFPFTLMEAIYSEKLLIGKSIYRVRSQYLKKFSYSFWDNQWFVPSSSALIPMSNIWQIFVHCKLQCLFSHSFTTYEWLNRDCDVQIYIGITSRFRWYWILMIAFRDTLLILLLPDSNASHWTET
jgi:hypothetical protein